MQPWYDIICIYATFTQTRISRDRVRSTCQTFCIIKTICVSPDDNNDFNVCKVSSMLTATIVVFDLYVTSCRSQTPKKLSFLSHPQSQGALHTRQQTKHARNQTNFSVWDSGFTFGLSTASKARRCRPPHNIACGVVIASIYARSAITDPVQSSAATREAHDSTMLHNTLNLLEDHFTFLRHTISDELYKQCPIQYMYVASLMIIIADHRRTDRQNGFEWFWMDPKCMNEIS